MASAFADRFGSDRVFANRQSESLVMALPRPPWRPTPFPAGEHFQPQVFNVSGNCVAARPDRQTSASSGNYAASFGMERSTNCKYRWFRRLFCLVLHWSSMESEYQGAPNGQAERKVNCRLLPVNIRSKRRIQPVLSLCFSRRRNSMPNATARWLMHRNCLHKGKRISERLDLAA